MPLKDGMEPTQTETEQPLNALISNVNAIRSVAQAVAGTLGPKGLDCMLVDETGRVVVTNDGVTILRLMDVDHPAANLLISAAEHQEALVGDGTTTTTVLAAALVQEGLNQVFKGVPAVKVIEGIRIGLSRVLELLERERVPLEDLADPRLDQIALIAGREERNLAELVVRAARLVGGDRLRDPGFVLADSVLALEGAESELLLGTIINKEPLNRAMPQWLEKARILILDDALEPIKVDFQALGTEIGFNRQLCYEKELLDNLNKLAELNINVVVTDRFISDQAESVLTDLGILAVSGVARPEWENLARMSGARPVKKEILLKSSRDLEPYIGTAGSIFYDQCLKVLKILAGSGQKTVTILVGAYTKEVVEEKERIVKDAAAAVQAAWRSGVVPGGGSLELGIARMMQLQKLKGLSSYGYDCLVQALKQPISQICHNAGFNPLEKVAEVMVRQAEQDSMTIGINCETGAIEDLAAQGIWDPFLVKWHAIKSAVEVGEAILRIDTIIKMKGELLH